MKCHLILLSALVLSSNVFANNERLASPQKQEQTANASLASQPTKQKKVSAKRGLYGFVAGKMGVYSAAHLIIVTASALTGPAAPATFIALEKIFALPIEAASNVAGAATAAVASGAFSTNLY